MSTSSIQSGTVPVSPSLPSKQLVLLIPSFEYGGAERQLVTLAIGLKDRSLLPVVVCFRNGGPLQRFLDEHGIPVVSLDKRNRWDLAAYLVRLPKILHQLRPAFVYGFLGTPNILSLLTKIIRPGSKAVWGIRDSNIDLGRYGPLVRLNFRLAAMLSRWADLIIANSATGMRHYIQHGYAAETMVVIPNGIDVHQFKFDAIGRQRYRQLWQVPEDCALVGHIGRLDPQKDHPTFLRAASLHFAQNPHTRYVCVGSGNPEYASQLKILAAQLGLEHALIWAGPQSQMAAIYSACDLVVVSSAYGEGFPNVLAEAMACGTPCTATDTGDSREVLGPDAILVQPRRADELAAAIAGSLQGHLPEQREAIREKVVRRFSTEALVARTEEALCQLA